MDANQFHLIEEALEDFRAGKQVILVDDEDRENEGDLCCAAEKTTPDIINFMATHGKGLICLAMTPEQIDRLQIPMMTNQNNSPFETNFTVSIEASRGVTTGISAFDRAKTILDAAHPEARPEDIVVPGHIFPLKAKPGGVLQRAGQTEGSVDLARLAGLIPAGVICEILNEDGSMARYPQLKEFSEKHDIKIISIKDLIAYRLRIETQIEQKYSSVIQTAAGEFNLQVFKNLLIDEYYFTFSIGEWNDDDTVPVRVTSINLVENFFSSPENPDDSIHRPLLKIREAGHGVLIGIVRTPDLSNALENFFSPKPSKPSGPEEKSREFRDYGFGAQILREMKLKKIVLISNHDIKLVGLEAYGIEVTGSISF